MPETTPKSAPTTQPQAIDDERLDAVNGGLIGLLRTSNISDGTSNTATGLTKAGPGTLTLGSTNF